MKWLRNGKKQALLCSGIDGQNSNIKTLLFMYIKPFPTIKQALVCLVLFAIILIMYYATTINQLKDNQQALTQLKVQIQAMRINAKDKLAKFNSKNTVFIKRNELTSNVDQLAAVFHALSKNQRQGLWVNEMRITPTDIVIIGQSISSPLIYEFASSLEQTAAMKRYKFNEVKVDSSASKRTATYQKARINQVLKNNPRLKRAASIYQKKESELTYLDKLHKEKYSAMHKQFMKELQQSSNISDIRHSSALMSDQKTVIYNFKLSTQGLKTKRR